MMELGQASGSTFQCAPAPPAATLRHVALGDLWEAIEAREVVERALVRLAAYRRTDQDLVHLDEALGAMRRAGDDREAFNAGDFAFHVVLSDAAHNGLLAARLAALHHRVQEMIALYTETAFREQQVAELLDAHVRLGEAVARQDADLAPTIMSEMMARLRDRARAVALARPHPSPAGPPARQSKGEGP